MGNAGRVLMIPKGDYNPATPYEMLDCVYYNGRSYVCKQASTGHAPTDTTYWQPMTPDASAEIQALTNQLTNEVTTRATLGGHNLVDISGTTSLQYATITFANNGFTVTTDSRTYAASETHLDGLKVGERYKLSFKVTSISGEATNSARGAVRVGSGVTSYVMCKEIGSYSLDFTYEANMYLSFMATYSTGAASSLTVDDVMIRLASDAGTDYQPYAKTNVELTDLTAFLGKKPYTSIVSTNNFEFSPEKYSAYIIMAQTSSNTGYGLWYVIRFNSYMVCNRLDYGSYDFVNVTVDTTNMKITMTGTYAFLVSVIGAFSEA